MNTVSEYGRGRLFGLWMMVLAVLLSACGGGGDGGSPVASVVPVSISTQPADQAVVAGASVTFSVAASGDGVTYQWQRSTDAGATWVNIVGATAATYQVATTDTSLTGSRYRVVVSGTANSLPSSAAALTVSAAPVPASISVNVGSLAVNAGNAATFTVTASGSSLTYQWQSSTDGGATFVNIPGATSATLSLDNPTVADSGKLFRVIVSSGSSSVTSATGTLNVTEASAQPQITAAPAAVTVTAPAAATFRVSAGGTPTPAYLWEKSTNGGQTWTTAGSTATLTTSALALTDDGTLYRVTVSNSAGSTTSDAVRLTVVAASLAPTITTQPAAATVTAPSAALFSVVATGAPSPTYQWQVSSDAGVSFANITGATGAAFTTPSTSAGDNGKKYRVVVTNTQGSVTSAVVGLTVNSVVATSGLNGRAWATGQLIDAYSGTNVIGLAADIDDSGVTTLVFTKATGTRTALYASRGTPGAAGTAPSWTPPVAIDLAGTNVFGVAVTNAVSTALRYSVTSASNGDAYAVWTTTRPCTSLSYDTSGNCTYLAMARYNAALAAWEAPVLVTDTDNRFDPVVKVNAGGDLAVLYGGFERPTSGFVRKDAVAWRKRGTSTFNRATFPTSATSFGMDANGNLALVGEASQNLTTDYVAYRGNVTAGFGAQEVIDTRLSAANAEVPMAVGTNGQIAAFFSQNDGTGVRFYSAIATGISAPFTVTDLNSTRPSIVTGGENAIVLDSGDVILRVTCTVRRWSAASSSWSGSSTVPDNCGSQDFAQSPIGETLRIVTTSGRWGTYDAANNKMVQSIPNSTSGLPTTGPQFVYGASASLTVGNGTDKNTYLLSKSGIGVLIVLTARDVLPTAALPVGDGRSTAYNVWGLFLK